MARLSWLRSTAIAAVLLSTAVLGCSSREELPPAATGQALTPPLCASAPPVRDDDTCRVAVVGTSSYRYALLRAGDVRETIVVDPGGPGVSALAHDGVRAIAAGYVGDLTRTHNVLVVEEPWVTGAADEACRASTRTFHASFAAHTADRDAAAAAVRQRCGLTPPGRYGFSRQHYAALLHAIAEQERLTFTAFVGASFAAARLEYALAGGVTFDWATLARPFPVRATLRELHAARAAAVDAAYPPAALSRLLRGTTPAATAAEVVAARVAAGQAGVAPRGPADVRDRAARFWQTYGAGEVSLSLLAYWDEVCRRGGDDAPPWDGSAADTRGFLATFHAPCRGLAPAHPVVTVPAARWPRLCVVDSRHDTVTPSRLVSASYRSLARHWIQSADRAHASADGVERCIDRLTGR